MAQWKKMTAGILGGLLLLTTIAATVLPNNDKFFEIMKAIEIYTNVYKEVNTYYVDEIEPSQLMRTGLEAMVGSLDPYTNYISEADVEGARMRMEGQYQGIGAEIEYIEGQPTLMQLFRDQPADAAGLMVGDRILMVDGQPTANKNRDKLEEIMRGFPGTIMELKVNRPGQGEVDINLTRGKVERPNVPYFGMLANDIGYVALTTFTRAAAKNVKNAVTTLRADNPDLKGVVIDLRGNGGGLLNEAVDIVNIFVPKDEVIVTTRGKVKEWDRSYKTNANPVDVELPVAVLINGKSASASEIVSGALQDYDRAVLIGQRSYGKGLVQNIMETGYSSRVKITTAKYYIPSQRCIQSVRYENGEPVNIPDSERGQFKTKAGRTVLDGGGVSPDIKLAVLGGDPITKGLLDEHIIFDYVNEWVQDHPTIDSVADFRFTDWADFSQFIERSDFTFTSKAEKLLERAAQKAEDEGYDISSELTGIQAKIDAAQSTAIAAQKEEIIKVIEKEIAGRYYYQRGKVQMGLRNDKEVQEAIAVLNDMDRYRALLKP
ncbi:MAG: S41 family peptidase [Bacteroidota bacterium]